MTTRRMIGRTRPEWGFWSNMIFGWAALLDALVSILTLGFYCGGYQLTYASWRTKQRFQKLKKLAKK
jgi:hypothetical protein